MRLVLPVTSLCLRLSVSAQSYSIVTPEVYNPRPGLPGWEKVEDVYGTLQIPKETFSHMSTDALAESCLQCPLRSDIYALNALEEGLAAAMNLLPPLQELINRPEVASDMLQRYQSLNLQVVLSTNKSSPVAFIDVAWLGQILKRDEVIEELTDPEVLRLGCMCVQQLALHWSEKRR